MSRGPFWLYMLASRRNGTLYLGVTNDLVRRVDEHKRKVNPGFTQRHDVTRLVWFAEHHSIIEAKLAEAKMKKWRRAWKIALIEQGNPLWHDLPPG
jgi:putative endonuclease